MNALSQYSKRALYFQLKCRYLAFYVSKSTFILSTDGLKQSTVLTSDFHTSLCANIQQKKDPHLKSQWPFRVTMTEDQKRDKELKIREMEKEEAPRTIFAKVKYYFKRYWYIAVPAHIISCTTWFAMLYAIVHSGVDIISLLETLHVPAMLVEKIKETPPTAGVLVIALLLYKIATPLRYATTLVLIQAGFWTLRRMGKLRTVREVEYKVRTEYEKSKHFYGRKLYRYRNLGVRDVERKNSQGHLSVRKANSSGFMGKYKKDN